MKILKPLFALILVGLIGASALADCNPADLETKTRSLRNKIEHDLETQLSGNDEYFPDLKPLTKVIEELNACRISKNLERYTCRRFDVFGITDIGAGMNFEKIFQIYDSSSGKCVIDTEHPRMIRSRVTGEQILTTFNGMHVLNNEPICRAKDGNKMGRSFVFTDATKDSNKSLFFILDLGIPLEDYSVSQFWGMEYSVGKSEKLLRDVVDGKLRLRFSNGPELLIHPEKRIILSTNFLTENSYDDNCVTNNDNGTPSKRKYWPEIKVTEAGKPYFGTPTLIQAGNRMSPRNIKNLNFVLKTLAGEI